MGFQFGDANGRRKAERLVSVLGEQARVDRIEGPFPLDIAAAARAYEEALRTYNESSNVISLFGGAGEGDGRAELVAHDSVTIDVTGEELDLLREAVAQPVEVEPEALPSVGMPDDPWADERDERDEPTQTSVYVSRAPSESGFFAPKLGVC